MAAYHTLWDLNYEGLIETGIGIDPLWFTIQRSILSAFLLLAGAGLVLAHGERFDARRFWKREAMLVGAALAVSAGTWFLFGEYLAYFGVLHLIALGSILALPLIRAPLWATLGVAALVLLLPAVFSSDVFDPRWLDWIGFFRITPETADLVPVFPWFGVMLLGVAGMRIARDWPVMTWSSTAWPVRALVLLGRWSLVFYLVHQLVIFGAVAPIANWVHGAEQAKLESFTQSCKASCEVNNDEKFCRAYCLCALDMTVRGDLWSAPADEIDRMGSLCTSMAK